MTRRLALGALTVSSVLILLFCLVGGRSAEIGFALVALGFPSLLMALGAADRGGRLGSIAWPVGVLVLVFEACFLGMLACGGAFGSGAWLLGLPAATAIQLVGLFLVPLVLVALGYALTFDAFAVGDDDLKRLRESASSTEDE